MVPVHVLVAPATAPGAGPQLRHSTQKRLAGFGVDLSGIDRIRIEECELVRVEIVLEGKCKIPADAPVHLEPRPYLHIILEIRSHISVSQIGVARTTPGSYGSVAEQEAREAVSSICSGCSFSGVRRYVGGKHNQSCGSRLAAGATRFEVILVRLPNIDADIHGVSAL